MRGGRNRWIGMLVAAFLIACMGITACGKSDEERWQEQYDLGVRYLDDGNYEEAIIAFNAAIEIDPRKAGSYVNRAAAYYAQDNTDAAVADYTTALDLDPSMADVYCAMADIYAVQGDPDLAQQILQQGIEACGEDETLLAKVTELGYAVEDGQIVAVTASLESVDVQEPEVPQAWMDFMEESHQADAEYKPLTSALEEYIEGYIGLALNGGDDLDLTQISNSDFQNLVASDIDETGVTNWYMMQDGSIIVVYISDHSDSDESYCVLTYTPQNGMGFVWRSEVHTGYVYVSLDKAETIDCVFNGPYTGISRQWGDSRETVNSITNIVGEVSMGWLNGITTYERWVNDAGVPALYTETYENGYETYNSSEGAVTRTSRWTLMGRVF